MMALTSLTLLKMRKFSMAEILVVYQGPTFKDLVELMSSAGAAGFFLQDSSCRIFLRDKLRSKNLVGGFNPSEKY
jgi:hypothetical protein